MKRLHKTHGIYVSPSKTDFFVYVCDDFGNLIALDGDAEDNHYHFCVNR